MPRSLLLAALCGCGDPLYGVPLDDSASPTTAFPADVAAIFSASCAVSGCHAAGGTTPDLTDYDAVVGQASAVSGLDYVSPGDPDASYLFAKVSGTQAALGGSGGQMPLGGSPLSEADRDTLSTWILDGAPAAE